VLDFPLPFIAPSCRGGAGCPRARRKAYLRRLGHLSLAGGFLLTLLPQAEPYAASPTPAPRADALHQGLNWEFCGPRPPGLGPPALAPTPTDETVLTLDADTAEYDQEEDRVRLSGRILAERGAQRVEAEELVYDRDTGEMTVTGSALLEHPGVRVIGERAQLNIEQEQGTLWGADYRLAGENNARGRAQRVEIESPRRAHYQDLTYNTCPPGRSDWSLHAKTLTIDRDSGRGVARHARLRIGAVPVLYTPYLRFPIDDRRQSGFLVPAVGSSDETGFDLTTPYYFNIAPALDATLLPRYMSKRGLMLGGELRFLTANQSGTVYGEILPRDEGTEDRGTRGAFRLEQQGVFASRWGTRVNLNRVSDARYLEDFGNRLEVTSARNIEQRGDLIYGGRGWNLLTRVQAFQSVDESVPETGRPYARLPQIRLRLQPQRMAEFGGSQLELGGELEYVYFDHAAKTHGQRLALAPFLSWPVRRTYGHLIPKLRFYGAAYSLTDQAPDQSSTPSYAIPSASLDGRLVFERDIGWLGKPALQTLEPRLFYLFTPFEEQDDQPLFDTTELSFSYWNLFSENRFTGPDRIADANQLTIGLTSRTLARRTGDELLRASLGQILYLDEPEVELSGQTLTEPRGSTSALAAELSAQLVRNWTARASLQFEPNPGEDEDRWEKRTLLLRYRAPDDRLINASYQFDQGSSPETRYEDTDLSFRWPVGNRIEFVGRWLYSLLYNETMEAFAGLEYGRCCWRLSVVGRHFKNRPEDSGNTSIMLQLELAGLGRLGHQIDQLFERGVYGYQSD